MILLVIIFIVISWVRPPNCVAEYSPKFKMNPLASHNRMNSLKSSIPIIS